MDSGQFDDLLRLFSHSRRSALAALLGAAGGWGSAAGTEARKKRKKRKKKRKGPPACTPSCGGKSCGDDGCGGSCGDCARGTCTAGTCACPAGYEVCGGVCENVCKAGEHRDPASCACCGGTSAPCFTSTMCCSGICNGGTNACRGRDGFAACTFDAQCTSNECRDGFCTCSFEVCKGTCRPPCAAPRATRNTVSCECCVNNGHACIDGSCTCCCSGHCDGPTGQQSCAGLANGALCDFGAQCASGACDWVSAGGNLYIRRCV
jgi:hypothetical protein